MISLTGPGILSTQLSASHIVDAQLDDVSLNKTQFKRQFNSESEREKIKYLKDTNMNLLKQRGESY